VRVSRRSRSASSGSSSEGSPELRRTSRRRGLDSDSESSTESRGRGGRRSSDRGRSNNRASHSRGRRGPASRSTSRRHRSKSRRSAGAGSSSESCSEWSSSEDSADDDTWDSDSDAVSDQVLLKFEAYMGRALFKEARKRRLKRAFERIDKKRSGKIKGVNLEKALRYLGIRKRVSKTLLKRVTDKYGRGNDAAIFYRDMVEGCRATAAAVQNGEAITVENQVDMLIQKLQHLSVGHDMEQELAKLDTHGDLLLPSKTVANYLLSLGFKKSEKGLLGKFVSHFVQEGTGGKVPYQDFCQFCKNKGASAAKDLPGWKRATTGVDIKEGLKKLREERERWEQEGTDPLVWQVLTKLRQAVSDALNSSLARDYSDVFQMFDLNKDGVIDHSEMSSGLGRLGFDVNAEEVASVMLRLDRSGKGAKVDYKHFLLFCTRGSDRDQFALGADGQIVGNTYAGELESTVRQKIRSSAGRLKLGHNSIIRVFRNVDKAGKGFVSKSSLAKVASNLKWKLTNEELACLVARFDAKGQDRFDYKQFVTFLTLEDDAIYNLEHRIREFVASMVEKGASTKDCFDLFDRKRAGKFSPKDLASCMLKLGFPVSEDEARELIRRMDIDRDGKISFLEFTRAFAPQSRPQALLGDAPHVPQGGDEQPNVTALALLQDKPFSSGLFNEWSNGLVSTQGSIPIGPKGSVGEWLEKVASPIEQRNFFAFLKLVSDFENQLGLQQSRSSDAGQPHEGELLLQLGTQLKVSLKFHT